MSTWVEEFNDFQSGGGVAPGGSMKSNFAPVKQSRTEKIKAELKLLEWHKLANDAALKSALMQTKNIRENTPERNPATNPSNAKRIRQVVTNEQTKPLEVTKDFVLRYEENEMKNSERLTEQVERHISTLRSIREKLESKIELKERIHEYREWKKDFAPKKQAVANGQTLASLGPKTRSSEASASMERSVKGATAELATVLDSLNKLAQLESRITDLEENNVYQKMVDAEEQRAFEKKEKTALEFKKRRSTGTNRRDAGPSRSVYTVRQKKVPLHHGATLRGSRASRGGTFLTEMGGETTESRRDAMKRERQRKIALASSGQKAIRSRVQAKKQRGEVASSRQKKHEAALSELQRRRSQQAERMKAKRRQVTEGQGASGARKLKNRHLEDFQRVKRDHRARREQRGKGSERGLSSSTMPEIRQRRPRQPATRSAGTVTRRRPVKEAVARRRPVKEEVAMPPIVGSGVRGARRLQQQRGARR